ncbi:uncharacterized protein LAJ45_07562 [Morchella importuna]|uniref:uncharacterized protein n=1 Tax=Morchella importuna TaxID=1174673 RepID=UPI001E8D5F94|nr:uncharacterized protein LAJ45_07562 [Morchella importuna]KAH8148459.1 hypothetical protein LAJ45_07562 [Morchella importuna]
MLANAKYSLGGGCLDAILKTKEKVYDGIVEHLEIEGYPTEANPDFKEANISDLVYITLHPILFDFKRKTGRTVRLLREKEIVSTDGETGGTEEFVMVDLVSVTEEKFIFIVEAKRSSLGQAMKQCLLAMKDMRDNNGGVGEVYGDKQAGCTISYDGRRKREMDEGLCGSGGLHVRSVGQWRHRGEMIEGNITIFHGGVAITSEVKGLFSTKTRVHEEQRLHNDKGLSYTRATPRSDLTGAVTINMNTFGAFVRSYAGHFITGAFTLVATGGLIWDNHKGRRDAVDKLDTKIDGVKDLGAEVQDCQSMILENGHHIMNALDGNKKPMREWLHKLERCKQSGGEDCERWRVGRDGGGGEAWPCLRQRIELLENLAYYGDPRYT